MVKCAHDHVRPEICDQTLGVVCTDCNVLVAFCWSDDHIPESLWNRVCTQRPDEGNPCEQNRDDHCALCGEVIEQATHRHSEETT